MKILAFDTTGEVNSVAIIDAGRKVDLLKIEGESKGAELLILAIEEVMQRGGASFDDLDAIAVTNGPASFTSVRIGLAAAKGFVLASEKFLLTYDSLLTRAYAFRDFVGRITVCMDAKMNEFFVASFICDGSLLVVDEESRLARGEDLPAVRLEQGQLLVGSGANLLAKVAAQKGLDVTLGEDKLFLADDLALMAFEDFSSGAIGDGDSSPNYARQPKIGKRKI